MDAAQVVAYGVKKLKLTAAPGHERHALDGYLNGLEAASRATKQKVAIAQDAKVAATSEVDAYIKGE